MVSIKAQNIPLISFCSQGDLISVPDREFLTFSQAQTTCAFSDAHLAEFRNLDQFNEIIDGIRPVEEGTYWVGVVTDAVDTSIVSEWKYASDVEPNDEQLIQELPGVWAIERPTNVMENCALLFRRGERLVNTLCAAPFRGICRRQKSNLCNENDTPAVNETLFSFCAQDDLFFVTIESTSQPDAEAECSRLDAHLAEFRNIEQLANITAGANTVEDFINETADVYGFEAATS